MNFNGYESGKDLVGSEGGETKLRIYYMKKMYFQFKHHSKVSEGLPTKSKIYEQILGDVSLNRMFVVHQGELNLNTQHPSEKSICNPSSGLEKGEEWILEIAGHPA